MALYHSFEKSGNYLFKYRGQIPVILFLLCIPFIYYEGPAAKSGLVSMIMDVLAVVFVVLGFIVRAYTVGTTPGGTSGRNTKEQVAETLNTSGIYSMLRHPLYLGNYLIWAGIVLFTHSIVFFIIFSLAFWLYYERIMFAEERFLEKKFGDLYTKWSLTLPAFIPAFGKFRKSEISFSMKSVLRREYSGLLATTLGFVYIDILRLLFHHEHINWWRTTVYIFLASLIITLILRTLKHNTRVLD